MKTYYLIKTKNVSVSKGLQKITNLLDSSIGQAVWVLKTKILAQNQQIEKNNCVHKILSPWGQLVWSRLNHGQFLKVGF